MRYTSFNKTFVCIKKSAIGKKTITKNSLAISRALSILKIKIEI